MTTLTREPVPPESLQQQVASGRGREQDNGMIRPVEDSFWGERVNYTVRLFLALQGKHTESTSTLKIK